MSRSKKDDFRLVPSFLVTSREKGPILSVHGPTIHGGKPIQGGSRGGRELENYWGCYRSNIEAKHKIQLKNRPCIINSNLGVFARYSCVVVFITGQKSHNHKMIRGPNTLWFSVSNLKPCSKRSNSTNLIPKQHVAGVQNSWSKGLYKVGTIGIEQLILHLRYEAGPIGNEVLGPNPGTNILTTNHVVPCHFTPGFRGVTVPSPWGQRAFTM